MAALAGMVNFPITVNGWTCVTCAIVALGKEHIFRARFGAGVLKWISQHRLKELTDGIAPDSVDIFKIP